MKPETARTFKNVHRRSFNIGSTPIYLTDTGPWCNGSIRGSNPLGQSSNLWGPAKSSEIIIKTLIIIKTYRVDIRRD